MAALPSVAKGTSARCWFEPAGDALRPGVSHVFHTWGIVPGHDTHIYTTVGTRYRYDVTVRKDR